MAHIWMTDSFGNWGTRPLAGEACGVARMGADLAWSSPAGAGAVLEFLPVRDGAGWALIPSGLDPVHLNGTPVSLGVRVLRDRDEIRLGPRRLYYSTEELARVLPFPDLAQPACCPRCKQQLEPGGPAVACPQCRAWHHQSDRWPCWTYSATCGVCGRQPTDLDAGFQWSPQLL